ncbi:phosphonate ABC transporter, permease protein PhnE [Pseudonocardia nigra]|uniref:phosphonate ABC transporter, permease protein PhnE n=1 Tax=Pseudonocardia nigra TaxID=1921578 RepID=UPI001C5EE898|nr:phosphonate ABC transporter, permease protein PhnE [Pseudonocardia nigra]
MSTGGAKVEELAALRRPSALTLAGSAVIVAVLVASAVASEVSPLALVNGVPNVLDFVGRMFPPDLSVLGDAVLLMVETLGIAVFGTAVGVAFAVPIGLLAARNIYPERWLHLPWRTGINFARAVPELLWALLFVSAVGLGPLAGTLAIALGSAAGMGRLFGDIFESADMRAWDAVSATGAGRLQRISWVLLPENLPTLSSYTLLVLDSNVRAATLLGLVGAGGIGTLLTERLRLFQYGEVLTIVLVVLVVVVALDRLSARMRRRLT